MQKWTSVSIFVFMGYTPAMLSQSVEYALRAMVVIATDTQKSWKRYELAKTTKVPSDYLSKILQLLCKNSFLKSQRGIGGGFIASFDPKKTRILDIVNAVDPIRRINSCPLHLKAHSKHLCPLHKKLDQALHDVEKAFASTTLDELTNNKGPLLIRPCAFPPVKSESSP